MSSHRTTVTKLTSQAPSAFAVLVIDGPMALEYVSRIWRPNRGDSTLQLDAIRYGYTQLDGLAGGESIVVCRTATNRVEVHCHGGRMASESIRQSLLSLGAIEPSPTQLHGSSADSIAEEAREELVKAKTLRTTAILLDQMRGALRHEFEAITALIGSNDFEAASDRLMRLQARETIGRHLIDPWKVVLAGPPNSGKSSLLNLLLGYSRAIVHEQAGTTRDLLAEKSSFDGWPIELIDGAGIRAATDSIEATGVERTLAQISAANCVLLLVDSITGWTETHSDILRQCTSQVVMVWTKMDLIKQPLATTIPTQNHDLLTASIRTSSITGAGLTELIGAVVTSLVPIELKPGEPIPFRERHRDWIAEQLAKTESAKI